MNDSDSSKLQKLYLEQVIQEIRINPDANFGDAPQYKHGRHMGRHFIKPEIKPHLPKSREEYVPSSEREEAYPPEEEYTSEEYPEIFHKDAEEVKVPHRTVLSSMDRETRREFIGLMSMLRQQIDDITHQDSSNIGFRSLSVNRELMDEVIADIVLGFAMGSPMRHKIAGLLPNKENPTFYVRNHSGGDDVIQVKLPYGPKTNHEDVQYIKLP